MPPSPELDESRPSSPVASEVPAVQTPNGRARATTASTTTTLTPPRVDEDFDMDLGGDFSKMILGNGKRASAVTVKDDQNGRQALAPRSLTASRFNQQPAPVPIQIDVTTKVEASPYSWSSQHSNDQLIAPSSPSPPTKENIPPPVPKHSSPRSDRLAPHSPEVAPRKSLLSPNAPMPEQEEGEDEEARLLKDSLSTVSKFMTGSVASTKTAPSGARYRRNEDDESLFDTSHSYSNHKSPGRFSARQSSPQQSNKVMTPAEFEKYRKDKERQDRERQIEISSAKDKGDDEEDNYDDDEDDLEKAKQQTKQRRKQEAHMAVYRQQMMKVTGESSNPSPSRPSLSISFSTPNLPNLAVGPSTGATATTDPSDEDEEIPLAILAAHGFPNKNRPPTRLSTMGSNPNLRASHQPSFQRPVSMIGDASQTGPGRLPAFARNLPQDPFLGAGLVRNSVRESFALGAGSPAPGQLGGAVPPGGLIGVIANEERNRAMRRGSPHIETSSSMASLPGSNFDPIAGIPAHMMYSAPPAPSPPALTPGDQAQIQMTNQMQQFMQMQMQFMQMMAGQNGGTPTTPNGHARLPSVGSMTNLTAIPGAGPTPGIGMSMGGVGGPEMRHSFMGNDSMLDLGGRGGEVQMRTMSMVQPSSASWIQPPQHLNFAPSIRLQGGGYTPSIAPSERSNIGLPGRYRPVSHLPAPHAPVAPGNLRTSMTMSGAITHQQPTISITKSGNNSDDDDDEEGWAAMKAKREKRQSAWKNKKSIDSEFGALIS